jgi:hypothetical protein
MVVEYKQGHWKYFIQIAVTNLQFIYFIRFLFFILSKASVRTGASAFHVRMRARLSMCVYVDAWARARM